ncbi:MAG: T9SS type A sorting domain-containing protein [Polaribacter sp.]|nr:T9SS type A sorting domain-containing protein [Polaribacter sp.]MDG1811596.1 T9SS type A sorting domain-containing protein [Polaribacter sp.]MDG2073615.1 T9SS type A sorting domain-containing protein [Polaribacter sp.]
MVKKLFLILFLGFSTLVVSQKSLQDLTTAPNPFSTTTNIHFTSKINQSVLLSIKNVLGKTVYSKKINAKTGLNKTVFKRATIQSGLYIYAIRSNNEIISKRLVIK